MSKEKNFTDAAEDMILLNIDTNIKFSMQKIISEMFCSQTVTLHLSKTGISKNKKIGVFLGLKNVFEDKILGKVDKCLKVSIQKVFLKMF